MIGADSRTFFQLAATLIPALIFGGILSDKVRPSEAWFDGHRILSVLADLAVLLAAPILLFTEVVAIEVGVSGQADELDIWLVSGVVVLATSAAIVVLLWPWLRHLRSVLHGDRAGLVGLIAMLGFLAFIPFLFLVNTIEIVPADPTAQLSALDALDKEVSIQQSLGLIPAASAARYHRCIAAQRLKITIDAAELTGWYFRRHSGQPILPSEPTGAQQLWLPEKLANMVARAEFLDDCPQPVYRNPYYRPGASTDTRLPGASGASPASGEWPP
jgi:hypothetical protein